MRRPGEFLGTSKTQDETLDALRGAPGMTPTQLATRLGISRQAAFERLSALASRGLVYANGGRYFAK